MNHLPAGQWALVDARLNDGRSIDLVVADERIVEIGEGLVNLPTNRVDAAGRLLLPAFIDTHIHLDKALIRESLPEHDGTLAGSIRSIQQLKATYTVDDVRRRAEKVIRSGVVNGSTRFRSHVDVDTIGNLTPLFGVAEAAKECSQLAETTLIAFPQEGLIRDQGAAEVMRRAMREGAQVVGGMPHWELTIDHQRQHVDFCFELAEAHDAALDMHVDETDDGSIRTLELVVDEAIRRGWYGRVTVGHVCSLAAADDEYAKRVIEKCAKAGVTVVSNPVTNLVIQGRGDHGLIRRGLTRVQELRDAGVNVAFGQDCVKDGFYPFGRAAMLEVALVSAHAAHLATRSELDFALRAITDAPAISWQIEDYGLRVGARADFQLFDATSWSEALRLQVPPAVVWYRGRQVAATTVKSQLWAATSSPATAVSIEEGTREAI